MVMDISASLLLPKQHRKALKQVRKAIYKLLILITSHRNLPTFPEVYFLRTKELSRESFKVRCLSEEMVADVICRAHSECGSNANCVYGVEVGYYRCVCVPPYKGNGINCVLDDTAGILKYYYYWHNTNIIPS